MRRSYASRIISRLTYWKGDFSVKTIIKNASVYHNHRFEALDILMEEGRIARMNCCGELEGEIADEVADAGGTRVVPGFLDIHTHGAVGVDVNGADAEGFEKICRFFASQGTTGWLCSVLTDTKEQTIQAIDQYKEWKTREHHGAELLGIHLEGPFLCPEYKGAMPEHLLRKPDMELLMAYQEEAEGEVRYITVSPEVEGIPD